MVGTLRARTWTSEQKALYIYGLAGEDPRYPPNAIDLLERLGGRLAIHRGHEFGVGDSRTTDTGDGTWVVEIHPGMPIEFASMAIARGIARWYLRSIEASADDVDELARTILIPEPSLRIESAGVAPYPEDIGRRFCVPISVASARLAKCGLGSSGMFRRA